MSESRTLHVLRYAYGEGMAERRTPHRDAFRDLLRAAAERGEVVLAGATGDPVDGGLLVFTTREAAEVFRDADPYGAAGLVTAAEVLPWTVVEGSALEC